MSGEKERHLTDAEERRAEKFSVLSEKMREEGFTKVELTVSIVKANIYGILLMTPFAIASMLVFFFIYPDGIASFSFTDPLWLLILTLVLSVVHEGIHGLTWGLFAKSHFRSIEFGFILKYLTPYCTCSESLSKSRYIMGCAMPTLILGFGLSVISICLGSLLLQGVAVIMIFGGGGDALIILKLLCFRPAGKTIVIHDHPYACGVVAFVK